MYGYYYLALHIHNLILLIVLVLLSAAEAQLLKILAIYRGPKILFWSGSEQIGEKG